MFKAYVTRLLPESGYEILKNAKDLEFEIFKEERLPRKEEIIAGVKGRDALFSLLTDTIDGEVMDAAPELKIIANCAVGFNNIDVEEATRKGIMVTNTPGVLTDATADFAFALLMSAGRRVVEADRFTRAGKFYGWSLTLMMGADIWGKTLGIIGLGRIGKAVASRAKGFNMDVIYYDEFKQDSELGRQVELDELLRSSDFISVHVPLLPNTRHLIDDRALGLMKRSAYLINTSRGQVVDERALVKALKEEKIAGAALDVYENEPEISEGLLKMDNVILAPHCASATHSSRNAMAEIAASNLLDGLRGKIPKNLINPEVLKKYK